MNVLFLHQSPCIRMVKVATALKAVYPEVRIVLAHQGRSPTEIYRLAESPFDKEIPLPAGEIALHTRMKGEIQRLCREEGILVIHSHNGPDLLTVAAIRSGAAPVVWDVHDMFSLLSPRTALWSTRKKSIAHVLTLGGYPYGAYLLAERYCARHADAIVAISPVMADAIRAHGAKAPMLLIPNVVLRKDAERAEFRKASEDGTLEVVFQGSIGPPGGHRDFTPLFRELGDAPGVRLHFYGLAWNPEHRRYHEEAARAFKNIVIHDPVPASDVIREISQYHVGVFYGYENSPDQHHLDSALPNKLFEYIAAGLPVLAPPYRETKAYLERTGTGITYPAGRLREAVAAIAARYPELHKSVMNRRLEETWEAHVAKIKDLYDQLS